MKKGNRDFKASAEDLRVAMILRRAVERIEERKSVVRPAVSNALRVYGVFDPVRASVVCSFPTQYYARQFVRNSKRPLYIYCFDFVQPLPTSLY